MKAFRKKQKDEAQLAMAKRGRAERKKREIQQMDEKTEDRLGGISCPQPYRRIILLHTAVFCGYLLCR